MNLRILKKMGKAVSFYCSDDILASIDQEANKSELINNLLSSYFAGDEDYLRREVTFLEERLAFLYEKLIKIEEIKLKKHKETAQVKEEKDERTELIEQFNYAFNEGLIDYGDYWDAYDNEKHAFNIDKIKAKLGSLNK